VTAAGGIAIEVVEQGARGGSPATRDDVENWIATFDLGLTTVHPADGTTLEQLEGRDHTYVVDLSSMEIVFETVYGDGPGAAIDDIVGRLGG
jgi:hypothetical protein